MNATGYRVPATWEPNSEHEALAKAMGVDLGLEAAAFKAFGRDEPIRNLDRAFAGWLRYAKPTRKSSQPENRPQSQLTLTIAEVRAFEASHPAEYRRLRAYLEGHRWWAGATDAYQWEQLRQAIRRRGEIFEFLDSNGRES